MTIKMFLRSLICLFVTLDFLMSFSYAHDYKYNATHIDFDELNTCPETVVDKDGMLSEIPQPGSCWCGIFLAGASKYNSTSTRMYPQCVCGTTLDKRPELREPIKSVIGLKWDAYDWRCICSDLGGFPPCVCFGEQVKFKLYNDVCYDVCPDEEMKSADSYDIYGNCVCEDGFGADCIEDTGVPIIPNGYIIAVVSLIISGLVLCLLGF